MGVLAHQQIREKNDKRLPPEQPVSLPVTDIALLSFTTETSTPLPLLMHGLCFGQSFSFTAQARRPKTDGD
jgi:hypothetical protein